MKFSSTVMMTRQQWQVEAKFIVIGDEDCSTEEDIDQSLGDMDEMLYKEDELLETKPVFLQIIL